MADEQYQDYPTGVDNVHTSFSMESESPENWPVLPELSWAEFLLWVVGRRSRHRIEGRSMLPTLKPGDEILYNPKAYDQSSPHIGDVVIAQHPQQPALRIIKRVLAVEGSDCWLLGDNRFESRDSRHFSWLPNRLLLGQVECRFGTTQ